MITKLSQDSANVPTTIQRGLNFDSRVEFYVGIPLLMKVGSSC